MQEIMVSARDAGQRFDKFLRKYLPDAPNGFIYKMLRRKNIILNGKKAAGMEKLEENDIVKLFLSDATITKFRNINTETSDGTVYCGGGRQNYSALSVDVDGKQAHSLNIVFEDEEILVINKPSGMLSQKAGKDDISLVEYIEAYLADEDEDALKCGFRPGICNRLDRNTTGLVVAGKSVRSLQYMNRMFRERALEKYYICLVKGHMSQPIRTKGYLKKDNKHNRVRIEKEDCDGAVRIETAYAPLGHALWRGQQYTVLKVHLITGKSHQIRAHLHSLGYPIVGDSKYGEKSLYHIFKKAFGVRHQLLHAWELRFGDVSYLPEQYRGKCLQAPLPELFQHVLRELGLEIT